jgi:hypothetical protein
LDYNGHTRCPVGVFILSNHVEDCMKYKLLIAISLIAMSLTACQQASDTAGTAAEAGGAVVDGAVEGAKDAAGSAMEGMKDAGAGAADEAGEAAKDAAH